MGATSCPWSPAADDGPPEGAAAVGAGVSEGCAAPGPAGCVVSPGPMGADVVCAGVSTPGPPELPGPVTAPEVGVAAVVSVPSEVSRDEAEGSTDEEVPPPMTIPDVFLRITGAWPLYVVLWSTSWLTISPSFLMIRRVCQRLPRVPDENVTSTPGCSV